MTRDTIRLAGGVCRGSVSASEALSAFRIGSEMNRDAHAS